MYKNLNPIIHSPLRLEIMSLLASMPKADFTYLKEQTGASSGNMSININILKKAGYIDTEKVFQGNTPKTFCRITYEGLWAFKEYVKNLQKYFN